jgi:hypothetical protein
MQGDVIGESGRKKQLITIFHHLQMRRPMLEYEELKPLFNFLKVLMMPCKHWSNLVGWTFVGSGTWKCYMKQIE